VFYEAKKVARRLFAGYDEALFCLEDVQRRCCGGSDEAILPLDPLQPLSRNNLVCCSLAQKRLLLALWTRGRSTAAQYTRAALLLF